MNRFAKNTNLFYTRPLKTDVLRQTLIQTQRQCYPGAPFNKQYHKFSECGWTWESVYEQLKNHPP